MGDNDKNSIDMIEESTEKILFSSRWLLAPIYLGLIVVLIVILVKFVISVISFIPNSFNLSFHEVTMDVLNLLDLSLLANLVLIVTFSGYENFVSRIGVAEDHKDRPSWMGNLDFSGLKLKIIGSVVAISLIELLRDFLDVSQTSETIIFWIIILHLTFVFSGLIFSLMEYIAKKK